MLALVSAPSNLGLRPPGQLGELCQSGRRGPRGGRRTALARGRRHRRPRPVFPPADAVHAGCCDEDEHLSEVRGLLAMAVPASAIIGGAAIAVAEELRAARQRPGREGYWLHLDVDILDPRVMPAVDSPDPGGLEPDQLADLLAGLAPGAVGAQVTVYDPDLDHDGSSARLLTEILVGALRDLGSEIAA
jgi:arginase